jgi:Na+/proline symporter
METREPLGKRLGRFVALLGVVFAVTAVVVITQRLSQDSLALLVGLACGVGAMLPTILLGLFLWRREITRQATQRTPYGAPPVVIVTPQALPGYGLQQPAFGDANMAWQWNNAQQDRTFTIVGGEE